MRGGFSFCGIDIADLGIEYAPENKDTYVYRPSKSNVYEETFDGHDGGYFFGSSKQPKEFVLRCYYEDKHIARGLMARIYDLFRVGQSGKLIFSQRPWCYYYATVTDFDDSTMYNYMNGLFVITMKAYYPFARGLPVYNKIIDEEHLFYNVVNDPYHCDIMENTGILDKADRVPLMSFSTPNILGSNRTTSRIDVNKKYAIHIHRSNYDPESQEIPIVGYEYLNENNQRISSSGSISIESENTEEIIPNVYMPFTSEVAYVRFFGVGQDTTINIHECLSNILLYNPGTERAHVGISLKGQCGDSLIIHNKTTGQKCRYVGFETHQGEDFYTDGINGKVMIRQWLNENVVDSTVAFLYHDYGFIELEPSFPIIRRLYVSYNGTTVTSPNMLYQDEAERGWYKGKFIFLGNTWHKIASCDDKHTLTLETSAGEGSVSTDIVLMNEIEITGSQNTNITNISFIYKPTYA